MYKYHLKDFEKLKFLYTENFYSTQSLSFWSDFDPNLPPEDGLLSVTPNVWKESIGFPDPELYAESFEKNSLKKSNIQEARQTLKIIGVAISSHIISFRFLPISRHFWITQENQNQLI